MTLLARTILRLADTLARLASRIADDGHDYRVVCSSCAAANAAGAFAAGVRLGRGPRVGMPADGRVTWGEA